MTLRSRRLLVAIGTLAAAVAISAGPAPSGAATPTVRRVAGADRYETAARLADAVAPGADVVYLASGERFPDALAAAPAAASANPPAPILLVTAGDIPAPTADQLTRVRPKRIIVLGGVDATSDTVVTRARELVPGATVDRVAGDDRYGTAAALAAATPGLATASAGYVATGEGFADPLATAATAASDRRPLLLTAGASVPAATVEAIERMPRPRTLTLVASANAVAPGVVDELRRHADTVTTVGGATPYETSALLAARTTTTAPATSAYLASGLSFPDALAAGAAAGRDHAPLLLVRLSCLASAVKQQVDRLGDPATVTVVGGELALTRSVEALATCRPQTNSAAATWPVGELTTVWVDPTRRTYRPDVVDEPQRTLPAFIAYPALPGGGANEPAAGSGPFPFVTVGHGLGSDPATLYSYARNLAAHGYVAVVPTFPLTNNKSPGGPYVGDLLEQARDLSFLLTTAERESDRGLAPLGGLVDPARIGASGGSFGAITSLMLMNECCFDARFKAVLSVIGHFPSQIQTTWLYDLGMPLLMINGTQDPLIPYTEARQGWVQAARPKFMATISTNVHDVPAPVRPYADAAGLAFLDRYVKLDAAGLDRLLHAFDGADPNVVRFEPAP